MLWRTLIHLSLVLLFAFTQIGVAAHDISHFSEHHEQHQQDQNSHDSQCEQCLSYSHAANSHAPHSFTFETLLGKSLLNANDIVSGNSSRARTYVARAPPTSLV